MRPSPTLLQQHSGWMFRQHWKVQGQRMLIDNGALKSLKNSGIKYENANDVVVEPRKEIQFVNFPNFRKVKEINKVDKYLLYNDSNVLIGGMDQARVFTNSIHLPHDSISIFKTESNESLPLQDKLVKRCIISSLVFDAYQEKLPKRIDPEREAWKFQRFYGITERRKNQLLVNRLLQLCSSMSPQLLAHRKIVSTSKFTVPFNREGQKVVLDLRADSLILGSAGLEPPSGCVEQSFLDKTIEDGLPNIKPTTQTVSIESSDLLSTSKEYFPFAKGYDSNQVHTAFVHFNPTEVSNIFDINVSEDQIMGRALMKSYAFAVAQARNNFGENVEDLPEPVTVQCIQTDSKDFYFSIIQLNTTKCHSNTDKRNFYWSQPKLSLYKTCDVVKGVPILEGYNPTVFKTILAFYYNS